MGVVSSRKWLDAIHKALLPPSVPFQTTDDSEGEAFKFSQLYQVG